MWSFRKALEHGAAGVEFDVRRCADGSIVVIHDDTLERTTNGRGRVGDLPYKILKTFDAGFGERIPLLSEVLDELGRRCLLNIELKDPNLAGDVKKLVLERGLQQHVLVSAFDWAELSTLVPEIAVALLASKADNLISTARTLRAAAIHPRKDIADPGLITEAHAADLLVHVWTVNEPSEISRFQKLHADAVFTDFPDRCLTSAS
jgi:glycerophosphoryl diester phosphodiesterase